MKLFGDIGFISHIYGRSLTFFEVEERAGELTVVCGHRDDVLRRQFDGLRGNRESIVGCSIGLRLQQSTFRDTERSVEGGASAIVAAAAINFRREVTIRLIGTPCNLLCFRNGALAHEDTFRWCSS
jgi:hypothetical protein